MKTFTITELKKKTSTVFDSMSKDSYTLITQGGKPVSLMFDIEDMDLEQVIIEARRYRARLAVETMRKTSKERGNDTMTMNDIDKLIAESRAEHRTRLTQES